MEIEDIPKRTQALIDRYLDLDEFTGNRTSGEMYEMSQIAESLMSYLIKIREAVIYHRAQKADDRCFLDDQMLYTRLEDGEQADNHVGDKEAMLKNCARFIDRRCAGGVWPTYVELEAKIRKLETQLAECRDNLSLIDSRFFHGLVSRMTKKLTVRIQESEWLTCARIYTLSWKPFCERI